VIRQLQAALAFLCSRAQSKLGCRHQQKKAQRLAYRLGTTEWAVLLSMAIQWPFKR
jgi:hypothetical protein